jgi:hypothetical protein
LRLANWIPRSTPGARRAGLAGCALLALLALLGCTGNDRGPRAGEAQPATTPQSEPALEAAPPQPVLDDVTITARVSAKLAANAELNPFDLVVATAEGVVSLRGRVETERQKAEAERIARETSGVRAVRNLVEVVAS